MDDIKPIKEEIVKNKKFNLMGCVFYGDPFHQKDPLDKDNEIAKLWKSFNSLSQKDPTIIENFVDKRTKGAFEVYLLPENFKETQKCHVFVGFQVVKYDNIPIEMFYKDFPDTQYAHFVFKGKYMFKGSDYIYKFWLPQSEYEEAFSYLIIAYTERFDQFHQFDINNEVDYYIPIKKRKFKK